MLPLALTGCGIGALAPATSSQTALGTIRGSVYGGQQPIVGAKVYLYAASTTGYGGPGIAASSTNASTSLLNSPGYVTTGSDGSFSITGDYTCTAGTQVYIYSVGGQPTSGTTNSAAGLLAALGQCPDNLTSTTGNFVGTISYIYMNEVSTVAMAYAVAGFASDAKHIGAFSSTHNTQAQLNLANAFANANLLYDIQGSTLNHLARSTTPGSGIGTVPVNTIDALANSLAGCVDSTGPTSTQCATDVFSTKSAGSTGTAPTDTATAAIYIAQHPGLNVSAIFGAASKTPPFTTNLSAAPNDWTIGITYTGGGIDTPQGIAIDASGDAWITNTVSISTVNSGLGTVTEISPAASFTSGTSGYATGAMNKPYSIAIDNSGNAWVGSSGAAVVTEIVSGVGTGHSIGGQTANRGLAIDGSGYVWVASSNTHNSSDLVKITSSFNLQLTDKLNATDIFGLAIDGAGNVWGGTSGGGVIEYNGANANANSPFTGGSISAAEFLAIDSAGKAWVGNSTSGSNSVTQITNPTTGAATYKDYAVAGITGPISVAIDGDGSVWTANNLANSVSGITTAGAAISGTTGYQGGGITTPTALAVDGSGNLWITNATTTVTELIGAAVPVLTPICAGLPSTATTGSSSLGTRP